LVRADMLQALKCIKYSSINISISFLEEEVGETNTGILWDVQVLQHMCCNDNNVALVHTNEN
jgi:hypothetical protein